MFLLRQTLHNHEFQWLNKFHQMNMLLFTYSLPLLAHFPPAMYKGSDFSTFTTLVIVYFSHSSGCEVIFIVILIYISLMINDV